MSDQQPTALFIAAVIESDPNSKAHHDQAAAELRRQHEEIQSLRDRLARQKPTLWVYRDNPGLTTMSPPSAPALWEPLGPIV
jgi:hypothetical protein